MNINENNRRPLKHERRPSRSFQGQEANAVQVESSRASFFCGADKSFGLSKNRFGTGPKKVEWKHQPAIYVHISSIYILYTHRILGVESFKRPRGLSPSGRAIEPAAFFWWHRKNLYLRRRRSFSGDFDLSLYSNKNANIILDSIWPKLWMEVNTRVLLENPQWRLVIDEGNEPMFTPNK